MEPRDQELLESYLEKDTALKTLWEEHVLYEKQLGKLESKPFLTPQEEAVIREIKKKKLTGKTKMQNILDRHRQMEA